MESKSDDRSGAKVSYNDGDGDSLAFKLLEEDYPFKRLLTTNRAPSTEEEKGVLQQISGSNRRLQSIRKQIRDLQQRICDLEDQEAEEQRRNGSYRRILTPTRRIPEDMLGEIFKHLHSVDEGFPLSISLVCSRWRQVILKTPRLWTTINIFPTSNSIELAKHFAIRCGPALPMRIIIHNWGSTDNRSLIHELNWLVPYRPRIQKFAVSISHDVYYLGHLSPRFRYVRLPLIHGGSFDGLKELELDVGDDDWEGVKLSFWNSATKADSLQKLRLINIGLPPANVGMSLDRLTHLYLKNSFGSGTTFWDLRQVLVFFANHPQLQMVELQNVTDDYEPGSEFTADLPRSPIIAQPPQYPSAESERVTLPDLKSFIFDFGVGTNWFLDRLTLPALKHLALRGAACWVRSLQDLAERSSFPLETFSMARCTPFHNSLGPILHPDPAQDIHCSEIRQKQIVDVLESCPTIREIKATNSVFLGTYLVERLKRKTDSVSLLGPNLQHLWVNDNKIYVQYRSRHVDFNYEIQAKGDHILQMLASRQPDCEGAEISSSLSKFKFYHSGSPSIPISGMSYQELYSRYLDDTYENSQHVFF